MNLKTTFALFFLLVLGAGGWLGMQYHKSGEDARTKSWRMRDLVSPEKMTRIEVTRGAEPRFVLEKLGAEWSLPGKWPVRPVEVKLWLEQLADLHTRFDPIVFQTESELGLDVPPLVIRVTTEGRTITLKFAEKISEKNRFDRPTYLRFEDRQEAVRLGPGVLTALDRPEAYFRQRRLFPMERVAREEGAKDKVELLVASAVEIKSTAGRVRLHKQDNEWMLQEPVVDHVEPGKLKDLLTAVPELWVEKFVERKGNGLGEFGLLEPEYLIGVTRPSGAEVKLLLGKISDTKTKIVTKPAPQQSPFMPPQKPQIERVVEEYRFAKLADNEQIFEVKTDPMPKIALTLEAFRDPRLARFKNDEVTRVEIRNGDASILLAKLGKKWKLEQPSSVDAEDSAVSELIEKLSALEAKEKDIVDTNDLKPIGLEKPATTIRLGFDEAKKPGAIVYQLGSKEGEKVYVHVDGNARVNRVDAAILKLIHRSALAYRGRLVVDISDLHRIDVDRPGEKFALIEDKGTWKLAEPVDAPIEAKLGRELAEAVGRVEAVEYIAEQPSDSDLDTIYGLAKPSHSVRLSGQDEKKPTQTLRLGKARAGKDEYFARLDQGPIFVVKKGLFDKLERGSLAYRSPQIWTIAQDQIAELVVKKGDSDFKLVRSGKTWKLTEPFEATTSAVEVDDVIQTLGVLKAERFVAHDAKDPSFGLEKPFLRVQIKLGEKETKELILGSPSKDTPELRYAKLGDSSAVFILDAKAFAPLERGPLELLDRRLLTLEPDSLRKIRVTGASTFTLDRQGKDWQVVDSSAPTFRPDETALKSTLHTLGLLEAAKIAAFGNKIDWKEFELDKPALILNLDCEKEKTHVIELGKKLPNGERYARVDHQDSVALLDARVAEMLGRSYLDFVDSALLRYDIDSIISIQRQMKDADLDFRKKDGAWMMVKPIERRADEVTVAGLLDKTFRLRAKRVAAFPAQNLEKFGLDQPTAVLTLERSDPKEGKKSHVLKIGAKVAESGDRFAQLEGTDMVVVLDADLAQPLVAPALFFADRQLTGLVAPDLAILERAGRKVVFAKTDGPWKIIEPIQAAAEDGDLEELIRSLQRLRADEIVADNLASDKEAKAHGLETPIAQWIFKTGDQEMLQLNVGAVEESKSGNPRRYLQLGAKGPAFLLQGKLASKLLEEYRDRKPWPTLDAAQVTQLSVQGPAGKRFTLEKREQGWGVLGSPDSQVNLAILTDTLDAFAGLKVQHYVADVKGNLQLHGLKPEPQWIIEVRTSTGSRKLLLGRPESDSRRLYASLPEGDAIFVLDEVASTRLARPLTAYLKTKETSEGK